MTPDRPMGHDSVLEGLWRAAASERLPHALLFTGAEGVGKFLAARWFLAGLFCDEGPGEPCASCGSCRRLSAGSFGDLFVVDPEAEGTAKIGVGRIVRRATTEGTPLEEFLSLRPAEDGWRGVILRDFELANHEAQNAVLKTLEEPGESCCLILISSQPGRLLETVRSRCVQVGFEAPSGAESAQVLSLAGVDDETASLVSRWAGGAPGKALRLAQRGAVEERAILMTVLSGELDALSGAERLLAVEGELGEGTPSALVRKRSAGAVELGVEMLRDLARSGAGYPPADLPHGDVMGALGGRAAGLGVTTRALEVLWRARREIDSNLAPEAVLDRALSEVQEIFTAALSAH
jgi:DNA polymerase III delta' subunit